MIAADPGAEMVIGAARSCLDDADHHPLAKEFVERAWWGKPGPVRSGVEVLQEVIALIGELINAVFHHIAEGDDRDQAAVFGDDGKV